MDGNAGVLVRILAVLGSDGDLLQGHRLASVETAVLENDGGVAEYEVDGAVDVALAEELAIGVDVERVLVPNYVAPIDHAVVRTNAECHRLVPAWPCRILKGYVPGDETGSGCRCSVGPISKELS